MTRGEGAGNSTGGATGTAGSGAGGTSGAMTGTAGASTALGRMIGIPMSGVRSGSLSGRETGSAGSAAVSASAGWASPSAVSTDPVDAASSVGAEGS